MRDIPFSLQLSVVLVIGLFVAGQLNRGIYRLAWHRRQLGPWTPPLPSAPPRRASDRLPVWGWIGLRRETMLHGRDYWIRPLLIELLTPAALATLYWWEMSGELVPAPPPLTESVLLGQYLAHAILVCLLIVATFIDIDEQTIPDAITVPGTLVGLTLLTLFPAATLPGGDDQHVLVTSPNEWPSGLDTLQGLYIGIGCFVVWCMALTPKTFWSRNGWGRAICYFCVSMFRRGGWRYWVLAAVGAPVIGAVWFRGGEAWHGLLTSLIGLAFGGAMVWLVRVVAGVALGREAMGFGDVTLLAMIGSYLGWQATVIVFFLAPFAGAVIAGVQYVISRRPDIAYGPFLSAATVVVIFFWADLWNRWGPIFGLGWLIPGLFGGCLIPMGIALWFWQRLRGTTD